MNEILQNILSGKLTRDNDEKHAGGLWDYAGDIVDDYINNGQAIGVSKDDELQQNIYYALWEIVDELNMN